MNFAVVYENLPSLYEGALNTIGLTVVTIFISLVVAIPMAVARESSKTVLRIAAASYSWIFRGVPSLAVLFFMYYGLPSIGVYLDAWLAAVIGLSLTAIAYMMEILRAGIRSVPTNQFQSARALGIPRWKALRRIIFPQALIVAIPPMFSEFTAILKGSTLASLVAVSELTAQATSLISYTYKPVEILVTVAITYLVLNLVIVLGQDVLERRFKLGSRRRASPSFALQASA